MIGTENTIVEIEFTKEEKEILLKILKRYKHLTDDPIETIKCSHISLDIKRLSDCQLRVDQSNRKMLLAAVKASDDVLFVNDFLFLLGEDGAEEWKVDMKE
jgi:hypothetical protein